MTKLTVIMPTYNGARFIRQQIDSILAQTVADFELLVMDDGSTDDTVAIVTDYEARDPRVRLLPSMGNRGQRRRLYDLTGAVDTEFLAIADQDDIWHPERNAMLLDAIGDSAVAYGRSQLIDGEGEDIGQTILETFNIDPLTAGPLTSLFQPLVSAHAAVIRTDWLSRAAFSAIAPFDHLIGLEAQLSTGLIYVPDATIYHRIHGGNQMNRIVDRSKRWVSPFKLRASTSFLRTDRLEFFLMLTQVSRSVALSPETTKTFWRAADACRYAWYQLLTWHPFKGRRLQADLHALLDRYAASPADLAYFSYRVASMTRPQFGPSNVALGAQLYMERDRANAVWHARAAQPYPALSGDAAVR